MSIYYAFDRMNQLQSRKLTRRLKTIASRIHIQWPIFLVGDIVRIVSDWNGIHFQLQNSGSRTSLVINYRNDTPARRDENVTNARVVECKFMKYYLISHISCKVAIRTRAVHTCFMIIARFKMEECAHKRYNITVAQPRGSGDNNLIILWNLIQKKE